MAGFLIDLWRDSWLTAQFERGAIGIGPTYGSQPLFVEDSRQTYIKVPSARLHLLVDGVEAELMLAQTADRNGVLALRLAGLPDPGRVLEMDGDLAAVLGVDQIRAQ